MTGHKINTQEEHPLFQSISVKYNKTHLKTYIWTFWVFLGFLNLKTYVFSEPFSWFSSPGF